MYSTKTKEGNWCEDEFGRWLVEHRKVTPLTYESETTSQYIHPNDMNDKASTDIAIESVYNLKVKNKEGLSYSLLFDHGYPDSQRFERPSRALPEGSMHREKLSSIRKEMDRTGRFTTQSRLAGALVMKHTAPLPNSSNSDSDDIPDFRRTFPLTNTVPRWF